MKKISLLIFICFCFLISKATNPVPNSNFENWTNGTPNDWTTDNETGEYICVTQTTPGYNSTYAAKGQIALEEGEDDYTLAPVLTSNDSSPNGFAITTNYNNFEFYYKSKLTHGDVFIASVLIEDAGHNAIGAGVDTITATDTGFTKLDINIAYLNGNTAASAIITFSIYSTYHDTSSYFIVDDVSLNSVVAGIESIYTESDLNLFPVPAHDRLTIHASSFNNEAVTVSVMNALGQVVSPPTLLQRDDAEVDVSKLSAGVYFVQLKSESGSMAKMPAYRTGRFVKE